MQNQKRVLGASSIWVAFGVLAAITCASWLSSLDLSLSPLGNRIATGALVSVPLLPYIGWVLVPRKSALGLALTVMLIVVGVVPLSVHAALGMWLRADESIFTSPTGQVMIVSVSHFGGESGYSVSIVQPGGLTQRRVCWGQGLPPEPTWSARDEFGGLCRSAL